MWLTPDQRYSEKLATPDTSIADLIGEVDPIRVAEGRYLSDELTIHYGLIPRTNRGIFAVNELPDLAERIQVGLLNIIEERDVQIRGYRLRMPLDVFVVATANPEDYTNRGRIITPLKDRFGAQVRTHYPRTLDDEIAIVEQERTTFDDMPVPVIVPGYMQEIVAELSHVARRHPQVNQRSGVSVRLTTANYENLAAGALRRALRTGEHEAVARISDLPALTASSAGKDRARDLEDDDDGAVLEKMLRTACNNVFRRHFTVQEFATWCSDSTAGASPSRSATTRRRRTTRRRSPSCPASSGPAATRRAGQRRDARRGAEFILEGLHLGKRLNKTEIDGSAVYGGEDAGGVTRCSPILGLRDSSMTTQRHTCAEPKTGGIREYPPARTASASGTAPRTRSATRSTRLRPPERGRLPRLGFRDGAAPHAQPGLARP